MHFVHFYDFESNILILFQQSINKKRTKNVQERNKAAYFSSNYANKRGSKIDKIWEAANVELFI